MIWGEHSIKRRLQIEFPVESSVKSYFSRVIESYRPIYDHTSHVLGYAGSVINDDDDDDDNYTRRLVWRLASVRAIKYASRPRPAFPAPPTHYIISFITSRK